LNLFDLKKIETKFISPLPLSFSGALLYTVALHRPEQ